MPNSEYRARQVRAKTSEVVAYNRDEEKPGKPLHILIPGGLVALAALGTIILVGYLGWITGEIETDLAGILILVLAPFYVGGVFLFSYGYELYDLRRAIRLTAIIVFVTLASVVIVAVLLLALGNLKGGSGSSSKSSSKSGSGSKSSASSGSRNLQAGLGAAASVGSKSSNTPSSGNSSSSGGGGGVGSVFIHGGGPATVHTREVTKEVIKEVAREPMPIRCPFCARSYLPAGHKFACPSCGAATPRDLIAESQEPKSEG